MDLNNQNLTIFRYLLSLKGIGKFQAQKICGQLGVNFNTKLKDLSSYKSDELNRLLADIRKIEIPHIKIKNFVNLYPPIGLNLTRFEDKSISRIININSYKGRRLKYGYPARGQRTRSNANTSKPFRSN